MEQRDFHDFPEGFLEASSVTVGNFDGVHLGHREIIRRTADHARRLGVPSVVITFDPHPREVIYKGEVVPAIIPFAERARLIAELGVDYLAKVEFTEAFAAQSPDTFVDELCQRFNPRALVIGHDFKFGKGRSGDQAFLVEAGKSRGFTVEAVEAVSVEGKPVHSTDIRRLIQAGKLKRAREYLGAPFHIEGEVVRGHGRGKGLGFATANIKWEAKLIPPDGVYACVAYWNGDRYPAVVNIGDNPTFDDEGLSMEAHIMGFTGDLYGRRMRLAFFRRLRGEIKFKTPAALVEQIRKDVARAKIELMNEVPPETFHEIDKALGPGTESE